jgi:hypothetical protein
MNDLAANEKTKLNRWTTLMVVCVLFFIFLLSLTFYTFIHEGGHALLGLLFGGKITSFSINFFDISAHASIDGQFTLWQQALISVAGVSLPILVCMLFLLFSAKRGDIVLYSFKAIFFLVTVNTLLAWMVIPVLAMMGKSVSDDSFNFLNFTHISPLPVTGVALLVYIFCWVLFFSQMGGAGVLVKRLRSVSIDLALPQARNSLLSLAAVGIVVLAAAIGLTLTLPNATFDVPPGYQQVSELDLSKNSLTNQSIYRFALDAPTRVNLYFLLNNVRGAPVNIRLTGPADYETVFLSMTDPNTMIGRASVSPQTAVLEKGDYEIRVSFPSCMGKVRVYVKMEGQ